MRGGGGFLELRRRLLGGLARLATLAGTWAGDKAAEAPEVWDCPSTRGFKCGT